MSDFENNCIKYRTTDLGIVVPSIKHICDGLEIVSNIYEKDGFGYITFNREIDTIWSNAFENCHTLSNIYLPNSIRTIDSLAFGNCVNLSMIDIPDNVETINTAFMNCGLVSVYIPASVKTIHQYAFYGCRLVAVHINPDNTMYDSRDECFGLVESKTNTLLIGTLDFSQSTAKIPNSIETIASNAFYKQKDLTTVEIPEKVKSIHTDAFYGCSELITIKLNSKKPPVLEPRAFPEGNYTIFVPAKSYDEYMRSNYWSKFSNKIQPVSHMFHNYIIVDTESGISKKESWKQNESTISEAEFHSDCVLLKRIEKNSTRHLNNLLMQGYSTERELNLNKVKYKYVCW